MILFRSTDDFKGGRLVTLYRRTATTVLAVDLMAHFSHQGHYVMQTVREVATGLAQAQHGGSQPAACPRLKVVRL